MGGSLTPKQRAESFGYKICNNCGDKFKPEFDWSRTLFCAWCQPLEAAYDAARDVDSTSGSRFAEISTDALGVLFKHLKPKGSE